MMRRLSITCGLVTAVLSSGLHAGVIAHAEGLQLYTIEAPPMTMGESRFGQQGHGFVADIAMEAIVRAGYVGELQFLPWLRGQQIASTGENDLITPLARTPEREAAYTWIAPLYRLERAFATLDRPIDSFADARSRLRSILVGRGSAQEEMLRAMGFDDGQLQHVDIGLSEIEMMKLGHVDAWFNSTIESEWKWRQSGETAPLVFGKPLYTDEIYLACSKRCAADLVQRLQAAVQTVQADGTATLMMRRYLGSI